MAQQLPQPKPSIAALKQYSPGASQAGAIKLSSNESPYAPPGFVRRAIWRAMRSGNRYPLTTPQRLVGIVAGRERVSPQQVVLGNGSDELMQLLCSAFVGEGDCGVVPHYTFSVYAHALRTVGATVQKISMPHYRLSYEKVSEAMRLAGDRCRMIFVTTPNSPTGCAISRDELQHIIDMVPPKVLLVIDYAYVDFMEVGEYIAPHEVLMQHPNVIFLKTMSKLYGLAGLRIGYALSSSVVSRVLQTVRLPFSVNECAAGAAIAALQHQAYYRKVVAIITAERKRLCEQLLRLGYGCIPSHANFVMVGPLRQLSVDKKEEENATEEGRVQNERVAEGAEHSPNTIAIAQAHGAKTTAGASDLTNWQHSQDVANMSNDSPAQRLYRYLKECGYIIRPLDSFGLPQFVRISIGAPKHNRGIIRALQKLVRR